MSDLHLWRLAIDPARLAAIAREQQIPLSDEDQGYAGHALLCGLFGKAATPKPWYLDPKRMLMWAYAARSLDQTEVELSDPLYVGAIDWSRSGSKPMPTLARGRAVAFDVRACPVVRNGGRNEQRGTEHDYLLWYARREDVAVDTLDAGTIYAAWLRERGWDADLGATLSDALVTGWMKPHKNGANTWRGRSEGRTRLPDVSFSGSLVITDSAVFTATLARGIGRHRAFGFGMIRLKPVTSV